ncbi:MAG: response regulator [Lachnospiraceae bacterium]|nr:response regulator [Lachnospiraceae bacterium]
MKKSTKNAGIVIAIAVLLIIVTITNSLLVFRMTSEQMKNSGIDRLKGISGELRSTINEAEKYTMELALRAREYVSDKTALTAFIFDEKEEIEKGNRGCFNLYIAGKGWDIIPGFDDRSEDFEATGRDWYRGAVRNGGSVYLTSPYIDVVTGNICYTVSVMLGDQDTVLGVDYTMDNIHDHIKDMFRGKGENAIVVTEDGIIAGCRDESLIRSKLTEVLPEYAGVFALAKSKDDVVETRIKAEHLYENLFASGIGSGWYLIVSSNDWEMYGNAYVQMLLMLLLSLALMGVVTVLYMLVLRNQAKAEAANTAKEEFLQNITVKLAEPLNRILELSRNDTIAQSDNYEADFSRIHASGEQLSEMIGQIISYSSIVKTARKQEIQKTVPVKGGISRRFRTIIIVFMIVVMLVSLYSNISATYRWGTAQMQNEVNSYEYPLSQWIDKQKSILDMFCSVISTDPGMLADYEGTVRYLNEITRQYPDISVSYLGNPYLEPTVFMNNGWLPEEGWHVEERQWYIDTMQSKTGWSISAPYYDSQTGLYTVTFSKTVRDSVTGEFLGIFGLDYYVDKLVGIMGSIYSENGYAFLVDSDGNIVNHPYGSFQMSPEHTTNVNELYGQIVPDGRTTRLFKDYDGSVKVLIASRNEESDFIVYCIGEFWDIYGKVVAYGLVGFVSFLACIIMVFRLLTELMRKQEEYSHRMKEAADTAIAAGKAKSQFLAQMSHEIRTPINAVLGMNEMILRETDENNILEYSNNIQSAGRTLLSLINSILDFSKIEDGKMEIIPVRYETAVLVSGLVNSIYERAREKGLDFITEVDETLPKAMLGDDVRLSQIVMNLLTNAVKYTEKGSVILRMRNGGREGDSVILNVEVEDTGIGIRKEDIGKMFESFSRLDEKRNRNIEGTGLGMAIVTRLLEMMGGTLTVESVYGEGSVFSFRVKQQIVDATQLGRYQDRREELLKEYEGEKYLYTTGARVLVVDDNTMNLAVAKNLLKLCNIVPDMVKSGYEAIDILKGHKYDVIFLDHMMPKLDGIETLKIIREEKLEADAKIIALTANAVAGVREEYLAAGFDDYMSKPIDLHRLEDMLMRYLPKGMAQYRTKRRKHGLPADRENRTAMKALLVDSTQLNDLRLSGTNGSAEGSDVYNVTGVNDMRDGHEVNDLPMAGRDTLADDEYLEFLPEGEQDDEFLQDDVDRLNSEPGRNDGANGSSAEKYLRAAQKLDEAGIDRSEGFLFCGEDEDIYVGVMLEYGKYGNEYSRDLQRYLDEDDMGNYAVIAHAIKSTSKTIGAKVLSEEAKALEMAAKNRDTEYVRSNHDAFLAKYTALTELLLKEFKD